MSSPPTPSPARVRVGQRVAQRGFGEILAGVTRRTSRVNWSRASRCSPSPFPNSWRRRSSRVFPPLWHSLPSPRRPLPSSSLAPTQSSRLAPTRRLPPSSPWRSYELRRPRRRCSWSWRAVTAVLTGLVLTAIGLARLGWIADFLSLPIITGFIAGIGVTIVVHQLPNAFGVVGGARRSTSVSTISSTSLERRTGRRSSSRSSSWDCSSWRTTERARALGARRHSGDVDRCRGRVARAPRRHAARCSVPQRSRVASAVAAWQPVEAWSPKPR